MKNCPCCGWPGTPPDDEAFRLRYLRLPPDKKKALREMAEALMKTASS